MDCVAVCFLHSHAYPRHEERAAQILRKILGHEVAVITSSSVYPEFREYERFSTAVLNGALLTVASKTLNIDFRRSGGAGTFYVASIAAIEY